MSKSDISKERGIKHIKNKKKYKQNAKASVEVKNKIVQSSKKVVLESNWDRYDVDDEDDVHKLTIDTDFSVLSNAPITCGNTFQFKDDLKLAEEIDARTLDKLDIFKLDLTLLEKSIGCISFDRRSEIDKDIFTDAIKAIINDTAQENRDNYQEYLENQKVTSKLPKYQFNCYEQEDSESTATESENEESEKSQPLEKNSQISQDLDQLKIKDNAQKSPASSKSETQEEELEKWLDDVLDN